MQYDIYINNEAVGSGLSYGELNQWVLDLDDELTGDNKCNFRRDLGLDIDENLEEFLYSNTLQVPFKITHKENNVIITESDF